MTPKLNRNDCDSFYCLMEAGRPMTVREVAEAQRFSSVNLAAQSLRRLVIHGLAVKIAAPAQGFGNGALPSHWHLAPGAVFPGVAPRAVVVHPEVADPIEHPVQLHSRGEVPQSVRAKVGLAGLVAQIVRR